MRCVPTPLGAHNPRIDLARELLSKKGRRDHGRFAFEGPTLLEEALSAGVQVELLYVTARAYDSVAAVQSAESGGTQVYIVDERSMARISDVQTPTGLLAVAPIRLEPVGALLEEPGLVLALAGLNDPGNAGTLLRSAEAFGVTRAIFGSGGAEPHQPKVVRAAMGAFFRLRLAVATPGELRAAASGWEITGLSASGRPLDTLEWRGRDILAVGSERKGLDAWEPLCGRLASIPMRGNAESLNASVAGSIALYQATKG